MWASQCTWASLLLSYEVLKSNKEKILGHFNAEEDEKLLVEVFKVNKNAVEDGQILMKDLQRIGKQLARSPDSVQSHWMNTLLPTIKRYHAGTLSTDMRELLVNHMVENKLNYHQDIDWKELEKLPQFAGTTSQYLSSQLVSLQNNVLKKHPELTRSQITAETLQGYLDNKEPLTAGTGAMKNKRDEYKELLIQFYVENILKK